MTRRQDHGWVAIVVGSILGALLAPAQAATVLIDFDEGGAPCEFALTNAARSEYAAQGVTFSGPGNDGGGILDQCSDFGVSGHSSPNFLAFNSGLVGYYLNGGTPGLPQAILFSPPASNVQFNAGSGNKVGVPFLLVEAFDSTDTSLGSVTPTVTAVLSAVSLPYTGIAKIEITSTGPDWYDYDFVIDDLSFEVSCPPSPLVGCGTAEKSMLSIKDDAADDSRDRFVWQFNKAVAAINRTEFGDPVAGGNTYDLCVYDQTDGEPALAIHLAVPGGGTCGDADCWSALSDKGYKYKDSRAGTNGITKVLLKGGDAGKGKIVVQGKGAGLALPGPVGTKYFNADTNVIVQLHESSTDNCWESSFVDATDGVENSGTKYKAKTSAP
jgi:hypothetical protein